MDKINTLKTILKELGLKSAKTIEENVDLQYYYLENLQKTLNNIAKTIFRVQDPKNDFEIKKELFLDGKRINTYVTKWDSYFMMGDNRDHSNDSRFWGSVPYDNIEGTPWFIYFSIDDNWEIRWDRIGKSVETLELEL